MDAVTLASVDAHGKTTRQVNEEIRALIAGGQTEIEVLNPGSRHNLAVGILEPARIVFRGDVGYFCGGLETMPKKPSTPMKIATSTQKYATCPVRR